MNARNRDAIVALISIAVVYAVELVVSIIIGVANPAMATDDIVAIVNGFNAISIILVIWADHRWRKRHRLAWMWSTYWRVLVSLIPGAIVIHIADRLVSNYSINTLIDFCTAALCMFLGLRWASSVYEEREVL